MERSYRYLGYFLLLMLPLVFLAFQQTYLTKFLFTETRFDKLIHLHAVIATLWVATLIVQPFLIVYKKVAWHRAVGKFSYILFPLLILSFVPGVLKLIQRDEYKFIFFPAGDCVVLIFLYAMAIYYKKQPPKHMRYMIASSLVLLGPTIGRIGPINLALDQIGTQTLQYSITFGVLIALIFWDMLHKRNYKPYVLAIVAFALHAAVFFALFI